MPRQLPPFVIEMVPPMYVGATRVLSRSHIAPGELFGLYLLRSSRIEINNRKVLLLQDLLEAMRVGMGYGQSAPASDILTRLNRLGHVQKVTLTDVQRKDHFPGEGRRNAAVFLMPTGKRLLEKILDELATSANTFLGELPSEVDAQFDGLFEAVEKHQSVVPLLQAAFINVRSSSVQSPLDPDGANDPSQIRFLDACGTFLGKDSTRFRSHILDWYNDRFLKLPAGVTSGFLDELERSAATTPAGFQRRAGGKGNSQFNKLKQFLTNLANKYEHGHRP